MRAAAICLAVIGICSSLRGEEGARVTFAATVQGIVILSQYSGSVRVVHFDPRFALKVKIESSSPGAPEFIVGETVVFAIHSPAQLFAPIGDVTGKSFTFSAVREIADGKPRFSLLQIERQAEQGGRPNAAEPPRESGRQ